MSIIKKLSLLIIAFSVVACGGAKDTSKTIKLWLPPYATDPSVLDKNVWSDILKPFAEENDVTIDITIVPWSSYEEKYLTAISSGQGPDIGYLYDTLLVEFENMNVIAPLDPYVTEADRENFLYLEDGVHKGQQLALPIIVGNPRILIYNKTLLKSVNEEPPVTWDDFLRISQKVTKDLDGDGKTDQWGMVQGWGHPHFGALNETFFPFFYQAGGEFTSKDGTKLTFNSPAGLRTLNLIKDMRDTYKIQPKGFLTAESSGKMFSEGKVAFTITPPAGVTVMERTGIVDWGYIPALKDKFAYAPYVADSLFMLSSVPEEKRQLVYDLMVYILSAPSMEQFHTKLAAFPPVTKDAKYIGDPRFEKLATEQLEYLKLKNDRIVGGARIYDIFYKNVQKMLSGELTPQQVLDQTEAEGNKILGS